METTYFNDILTLEEIFDVAKVIIRPAQTEDLENLSALIRAFVDEGKLLPRTLDEAVAVLQRNADVRVEIEGHTCNIGTAEYNMALGERRANSVRDYLISRGIAANRFSTVSYGEERPKYDNAREETRRLNRRAAMLVRLTR